MATLGFEISDQTVRCVVNTNGLDTLPVRGSDGTLATSLNTAITPAGPFFGMAAERAAQVQADLPFTDGLLGEGQHSKPWYQSVNDKHWQTAELLQTLVSQLMTNARDVAFERNWQVTVAVEADCHDQIEQWLTEQPQVAETSIQAIVSRQAALAAYWSAKHHVQQTVIAIDWAPRQVHLSVFTCSGGRFKLLGMRSISAVGLMALEEVIARALVPEIAGAGASDNSSGVSAELRAAIGRLWPQALSAPSGVGQQECWIGDELRELVLWKEHLRQLARPLMQRVLDELALLLTQVGLKAVDADRVVLLGGPCELLQMELLSQGQLSESALHIANEASAIAQGAAILSGWTPAALHDLTRIEEAMKVRLTSQSPQRAHATGTDEYDIGLRIGDPARGKAMIYKLIDAQAALPVRRSRTFRTSRPNQARLILDLVYVEPATGRVIHQETRSLQLPADLPAYTPIDVTVMRHDSGQVEIFCAPLPH